MTNEVQRFDITGNPGSGRFTLTVLGATTDPIQYHPAAGVVQTALEALPTVGVGNVVVTKDGNWGYVCGFTNALGSQDIPQMDATADGQMTGAGGVITVSTVTEGAPENGGGPPPEGITDSGGLLTLQTPCTVHDLLQFVVDVSAVSSGGHHQIPVSSTTSEITVGSGG